MPRPTPCSECGGSGHLYSDNGPAPRADTCTWCGGDGHDPDAEPAFWAARNRAACEAAYRERAA